MSNRVPNPPAYPATDSAVLYGDKELYARIGKVAEQEGGKILVEKFEIPIRSGKAWVVKKGKLPISLRFRPPFSNAQHLSLLSRPREVLTCSNLPQDNSVCSLHRKVLK